MNIMRKNKRLVLRGRVRKNVIWLVAVLVIVLTILGVGLLKYQPFNPQASFFRNVLRVTPIFYDQQVRVFGASPVKSDTKPGCVQTYQGYPPGEKSPSSLYPYHCFIDGLSYKTFTAPVARNKGNSEMQQFAQLAKSEGFVSKDGVTQDDARSDYIGIRYYGGKEECQVEVAYFYAVPTNPGVSDASQASYTYGLNCGGNTYPYIPAGYPIYSESSGFGH